MPKFKHDVKVGDIIHIYHMFGYPEYKETEGVVTNIAVDYTEDYGGLHTIFGTWGLDGLCFDDDWEIVEVDE